MSWFGAAFRHFADVEVRRLPLYARLCDGVASDRELLNLMAVVPDAQLRPNLLLNAVHFLVLDGRGPSLGRWYPDGSTDPASWGPAPTTRTRRFAALCLDHRDELESLRTRSTQTNEVGRCTTLLPALAGVAHDTGRPWVWSRSAPVRG